MRKGARIWGMAVAFFLAARAVQASFQVRAPVGELRVGLWQVHEKDGVVSLVYVPRGKRPKWAVSSPNILSGTGATLPST